MNNNNYFFFCCMIQMAWTPEIARCNKTSLMTEQVDEILPKVTLLVEALQGIDCIPHKYYAKGKFPPDLVAQQVRALKLIELSIYDIEHTLNYLKLTSKYIQDSLRLDQK